MQLVRRVGPRRGAGWLGLLLGTAAMAPIACGVARADTASGTPAVAPLVVDAKAPPPVPLLTQPVAATPQSITVIPAEVIQLQGLTDLRDVLRLDPSVSAHADEDSAQALAERLRGESPSGAVVTVEANRRAIYDNRLWSPFSVLGGLGG